MNDYVEVVIYDAETKKEFKIKLSPADAIRAENAFATTLLNVARQACENSGASLDISERAFPSRSSNNIPTKEETFGLSSFFSCFSLIAQYDFFQLIYILFLLQDIEMDNMQLCSHSEKVDGNLNEFPGESFKWSHEAVLLLLEEFRCDEKDMLSGKITHKKIWDKISETMSARGYIVTGRQCSTRFNTMKRTYKGVKDHNNKSGNNKRTWLYYENMDSLLGRKPYMAPISTLSSTGIESYNQCSSSSSNSSISYMDLDDTTVFQKRKKNDVANAILESCAIAEENKERMEAKLKLMEKLDKLLEKI